MKNRLTVVNKTYFQQLDGEATCIDTAFSQEIEGDEQPYSRKQKIGPSWTTIDKGWFEEPEENIAYMTLQNKSKENIVVAISEQECFSIPPGLSLEGSPIHLDKFELRSSSNNVLICQVTLFPK
jgi:hypothetical protein